VLHAGRPLGLADHLSARRDRFKTRSPSRGCSARPLPCEADDPGIRDDDRDCRTSSHQRGLVLQLLYVGQAGRQSRTGLVAAGVFLSNGDLYDATDIPRARSDEGRPLAATALPRYLPDGKLTDNAITTSGSVQFLNASSSVAGLRSRSQNDEATLAIVRIVPDSVTLTDDQRLDCDPPPTASSRTSIPATGSLRDTANDAFFIWDLGTNVRAQVQSRPTLPSRRSSRQREQVLKKQFWHATRKTWKKIKKLVPSGQPSTGASRGAT
jgi:hypothetical protein